tara:strand:+ start:385 stop:1188 length:804 start_codon:yes stop_codon:yes gene_type:complete
MSTKFSAFTAVTPTSATTVVGLDSGANAQFTVAQIDVNDLSGTVPISKGGTGQVTQTAALDAITDANNQVANDVLYIDGSGASNVAAFINPSQLPNVSTRIVLSCDWLNGSGGGTYFNFTKGASINVPYNSVDVQTSTDSTGNTITMNFNGAAGAAGDTTFTIDKAGAYRVAINWSWFDQNQQGMAIFAGLYERLGGGGSLLIKGLINDVASGFKNDVNYYGETVFNATAGQVVEIKGSFTGGAGTTNPFPATSASIANTIYFEYIG